MRFETEAFQNSVARRFRADTLQTVFAKTVSNDPIAISRIDLPVAHGEWTAKLAPEAAFSIHVVMSPLPRLHTLMEGRRVKMGVLEVGDICLYDLSTSPITLLQDPMQTMRIQISQRTLDDLAYDRGQRPTGGLRATFGGHDPILHSLCRALMSRFEIYGAENALFHDHVALAFHTRIAQAYGELGAAAPLRGGLAPWQLHRARELMRARLVEGVTIAELADACGISASYFARAFRRSCGTTAHKWLMNARIECAKGLLRTNAMSLPEIALACGFADQSHLSRAFRLSEGDTPASWRRLHLD